MIRDNFNTPNILTLIRLVISPVFAILLFLEPSFPSLCYWALVCAIVAELTDLFDGYMARKYKEVTDLGKILDPLADSIYRMTAFISLAVIGQVSAYLVLPILYRDSIVLTLRRFCAYKGIIVAARWSGKMKALIQGPVIVLILLLRVLAYHEIITAQSLLVCANTLMAITCLVTVYSAIDYTLNLILLMRLSETNPRKTTIPAG